jgi:hypothetical protein
LANHGAPLRGHGIGGAPYSTHHIATQVCARGFRVWQWLSRRALRSPRRSCGARLGKARCCHHCDGAIDFRLEPTGPRAYPATIDLWPDDWAASPWRCRAHVQTTSPNFDGADRLPLAPVQRAHSQ